MNIWGPHLEGARLLDLFAGSGAVGVEALGRGAGAVTWVEKHPRALAMLRANLDQLGVGGRAARIVGLDLPSGLGRLDGPFDLVFADPPYAFEQHEAVLAGVVPLLAAGARLAVEHGPRPRPLRPPPGLRASGERSYGDTVLAFFELPVAGCAPASTGEGPSDDSG